MTLKNTLGYAVDIRTRLVFKGEQDAYVMSKVTELHYSID